MINISLYESPFIFLIGEYFSDNTREIIREKALRSASILCFDTFDELKSLLAVALDKELAKGKREYYYCTSIHAQHFSLLHQMFNRLAVVVLLK